MAVLSHDAAVLFTVFGVQFSWVCPLNDSKITSHHPEDALRPHESPAIKLSLFIGTKSLIGQKWSPNILACSSGSAKQWDCAEPLRTDGDRMGLHDGEPGHGRLDSQACRSPSSDMILVGSGSAS